jgi:hypothetical protein
MDTSISEEYATSVFRVKFSSPTSMNLSDYVPCKLSVKYYHILTTLILTLKMKAAYSSETYVSVWFFLSPLLSQLYPFLLLLVILLKEILK